MFLPFFNDSTNVAEMKRMRWVFVVALIGIAIAVVMTRSAGPKEPDYNGRSLSSWVNEWWTSDRDRTNPAAIAILAIGSNGVPFLAARLSEDESTAERDLMQVAGKLVPRKWNPRDRRLFRSLAAAEAINLLGDEAKPAFPTLTNLLASRTHQLSAAIGLAGMGHDGIFVLLPALTNQDWYLRYSAAMALGEARSDFDKVVSALIKVVKLGGSNEEDHHVREAAAVSLVQLDKEPERVVPVIEEFLISTNARTRVWGAGLLGELGADARPAVPRLLKLRSDEDPDVREAAKDALKEIDPKSAP
jgi:HEAT repeat protein